MIQFDRLWGTHLERYTSTQQTRRLTWRWLLIASFLFCTGCINSRNWECVSDEAEPLFLQEVGCQEDFEKLASIPLDASIPGARSVKTVIDRYDDDTLYFQNSQLYPIHWEFVSAHLSGNGLPIVPLLAEFNATAYSSPSRRFLSGAITHYAGPDVYAYEIAPYDSATADMILATFQLLEDATYFGQELRFFASSTTIEDEVQDIADKIRLITAEELFAGIDYQPLNIAESYGLLRFTDAGELESQYLSFREIVVLDSVPNDISVVSGIITEQFQTPLSHINVLSRNRGTPNMALRNAFTNETLRALDGKWVRLKVGPADYEIEEVSQAIADAWWEENKPDEVLVPGLNESITELTDIEDTVDIEADDLKANLEEAIRAFGGKAAHYGVLYQIEDVPVPKAFAIPVYYYLQFMNDNGFDARVEALLEDENFLGSAQYRDEQLQALRDDMSSTPLASDFEDALLQKLNTEYSGIRMRFRSSTNAEDLDGFTGAGLYTSKSGDPNDPTKPVADAVRDVWASIWNFRAFEERSYRSIEHLSVAMALLVHRSFPDEEMNGVALTNNPFDPSGLEPAFYVNVQLGETSVVLPPVGVTADSFLYYFDQPNQPVSYLSRSSLTENGSPVLNNRELFELGSALDRIRGFFSPLYGTSGEWWAMDVEFKFDGEPGEDPQLFVKQARPYQ